MRRFSVILVAVFLAGCGAAATPTPRPTATPEPTRSPAQIAAIISDSIDLLYCAEEPSPDWCGNLVGKPGAYAVEVDDDLVQIRMTFKSDKKGEAAAMKACQNIAVAHFDDNAEPLGVTEYWVLDKGGETILAMCFIPE